MINARIFLVKVTLFSICLRTLILFIIARRDDPTLALRLDLISMIEMALVLTFVFVLIMGKSDPSYEIIFLILLVIHSVISYFHFRRYVFVGKRRVVLGYRTYSLKEIKSASTSKYALHYRVKDRVYRILFPIHHKQKLVEDFVQPFNK